MSYIGDKIKALSDAFLFAVRQDLLKLGYDVEDVDAIEIYHWAAAGYESWCFIVGQDEAFTFSIRLNSLITAEGNLAFGLLGTDVHISESVLGSNGKKTDFTTLHNALHIAVEVLDEYLSIQF